MAVSKSEFKEGGIRGQSEIYGEEREFDVLGELFETIEKFEYTVSRVGVTISEKSLEYEPSIGTEEPKLKRIRERSSREVKITLSLQPVTSKVKEGVLLPREAIIDRATLDIETPPEGAVTIDGKSVSVDSRKLSNDKHYLVEYNGEKHLLQVKNKSLALYEYFELKDGRVLINKLFEIESK